MKSHDIARALTTLARTLRDGENAELATLSIRSSNVEPKSPNSSVGANAPAALIVLMRLSNYSKDEWRHLISELNLDVPIKPTDSVRDILGRLLKYLSDNKDVQDRLVETAKKPQPGTSPELMKALSILVDK